MIRDATRGDTAGPIAWGIGATAALGALIVAGSRNLAHFDAALVAYTFSVLFATFGLTYRYAMWLKRPPTDCLLAARLAGLLPARRAESAICGGLVRPRASPTSRSTASSGRAASCAASRTC